MRIWSDDQPDILTRRKRSANVPLDHLTKHEVLATIPMLEGITTREIAERCIERYGSRVGVMTMDVMAPRVRKHLAQLERDGRLKLTTHGWYRVNRL